MRLFHRSILLLCLLLAGSSVAVDRRVHYFDRLPGAVTTEEGCRIWRVDLPVGGRGTWTGNCDTQFANGIGRLTVFDRDGFMVETYYGDMAFGLKYGRGLEMKGRDRYVGEFASGLRDGHGEQIVAGVRYAGEFRDGERSGTGEMTWLNRDVYAGGWKHGLPDGYGEVIVGTERISGQWRAGCLLDSERLASVATPLDSCRGRMAARTVPEGRVDDDPSRPPALSEGGCRPPDGVSLFLLCGGRR